MIKTNKWIWRVLSVLYVMAVLYLCLASPDSLPKIKKWWDFPIKADTIAHFLMFSPSLSLLFLSVDRKYRNHTTLFLCLIICLLLAGCTELLQSLSPVRSMELLDFIADSLSILISYLILFVYLQKKRKKACEIQ